MVETKLLYGGMDKERSIETMDEQDYLSAHNITSIHNEEGDTNYVTNVDGNIKITVNKPAGLNKVIGSQSFKNVGKVFFVRYNSLKYHQVVQYDHKTRTETIIYENLTDSHGEDILEIESNSYFTDIVLINEEELIINNGEKEIFNFNIKEGRKDGLYKEDITLIKKPIRNPPKVEYIDDESTAKNNLRGNLFQFKVQVEYEGNKTSVYSHTSDMVVPEDETAYDTGQEITSNNALEITTNLFYELNGFLGDKKTVKSLRYIAKSNEGSWVIIKEIDVEDIKDLPSSIDIENEIEESFDPSTYDYKFIFRNTGLYPFEDEVEAENLYDAIPNRAEAVEEVNGTVLAIGSPEEGYDRPDIETTHAVTYYDPDLGSGSSGGGDNFKVSRIRWESHQIIVRRLYVYFSGDPSEGDKVIMRFFPRGNASAVQEEDYTVTISDEIAGLTTVLNNTVNKFNSLGFSGVSFVRQDNYILVVISTNTHSHGIQTIFVDNAGTSTNITTKSVNSLKNNSSYQYSINYYDEYGRPFPIVTGDKFVFETDPLSNTAGLLPQASITIESDPPEGASYYRIGLTENKTTDKYITLVGKVASTTNDDYIIIDLKSLEYFINNEKDGVVNYDFEKGDKVIFTRFINGVGATTKWVDNPIVETDIIDFTIDVPEDEPNTTKYFLKVRKTAVLDEYSVYMINSDVELEIYTPKDTSTDSGENAIFYEIGDTYNIVDGQHSFQEILIQTGDSYFRGRGYMGTFSDDIMVIDVADPNFSDNYKSNYWSKGTPRTYYDQQGKVRRKGSIRYSDEYVIGSKINGISRFYPERIYGEAGGETTSKYGHIRKMIMRDNHLVAIQEYKVAIIPVYRSILQDNQDSQITADSTRLFGNVQYRAGEYGCGSAKTSIAKTDSGVIYFVDSNKRTPCRDTISNGVEAINVLTNNFFLKFIDRADKTGSKLIGYTHDSKKEYILSIEDRGEVLQTLSFYDSEYESDWGIDPYTVNLIGAPNGNTGGLNNPAGYLTYKPDQDYVGRDYISFSFEHEGNTVHRRIPVIVKEGDGTPDPFQFPPENNASTNTTYIRAIIVSGINMPTPISIVGGEYRIEEAVWTDENGEVRDDEFVEIKIVSSDQPNTTVSATLTIGGVSATFNVTTGS